MPSNPFVSLSAERGSERPKRAVAVVCSLLVGVLLLFGALSVAPAFAEDAAPDASARSSEVEQDFNLALLAEQAGDGYYNEEYYHVALPEGESVTVNMAEHEKTSFDFTVSSDSFCTFTMKRSTDSYMFLNAFICDDAGVSFEGLPVPKAGSSGPISLPAGKYHLEMFTAYFGSSNIDNVTVSFDTVPIKSGMIEREENNSPEQANELCASDIWGSLYIANALTTKPDVDCFKLVLEKPSHVELNLYNSGASIALSLTDGSGIPCVSTKTVLTSGTSYHGLIESDVFEPGTYYVCCESKKDSKAWGTTYLLTVNVSDIVHTVSFNANGGSEVEVQKVAHGAMVIAPVAPVKEGRTFAGWYSDSGLTKVYDFDTAVTGDLTLYAKWAPSKHAVTFVSNGGSAVKAQSVTYGSRASKPADPKKAGYTFKGWYTDKGCTKAYSFDSAVRADLTLYAKWAINAYTVTFESNGGSIVVGQTVKYGAKAAKPNDPFRVGHTFKGWYADSKFKKAYNFDTSVKSDTTLWAKWEKASSGSGQNPPTSFKDVPKGTWYYSWVTSAAQTGLMTGLKNDAGSYTGYFAPDDPLTRAQVATVIWRAAGGPSAGAAGFKDVKSGEWYTSAVAWCAQAGIVTGYTSGPDKGCFRPDRPVSRQELATMVWRFAKWCGISVCDPDQTAFKSTTDWRAVDSYAVEPLVWTAAVGIMGGVDNGDGTYSLQPTGGATRAQAAKVFVVLTRDVLTGKVTTPVTKYKVQFESNGGSAVKAQTVVSGGRASKPSDPNRDDYKFKGWYTDKGLTKAYNFNTTVKSNVTLYAKWEKIPPVYCVLYSDGLLSLQRGTDIDSSHGRVVGKWVGFGGSYSRPWDGYEEKVRNVVVRDPIELPADSRRLFFGLKNCTSMDVMKLDVSKVTNLSGMFHGCSSLTSLDVSGWDVSHVTDFSDVFENCESLASLDVSQWDVSSATTISGMFEDCSSLVSLDVSSWDVSHVTGFSNVFNGCESLASLDVSQWDVSSATRMFGMFFGCESLTSLDVSGWDVSKVTDVRYVFGNCSNLVSLNIAGWDTSGVEKADSFACNARALDKVTVGPKFTLGEYLPNGPWYDESGKSWDTVPSGVGGTFSKTRPSGNKTASEAPNLEEVDAPAGIGPENDKNLADVAVTRGVTDSGLEYAMVLEGAVDAAGEAYALDREYAELGGRYVGAGVYVTAYRGEAADLALPAQIGDVDVVSADLSWKGDAQAGVPDPDGRTRLESLSLERGCGLASLDASGSDVAELKLTGDEALGGLPALRFLDLSGTQVSSLDPACMPALERLALRGCPLGADSLEALGAWLGVTGLPADLEGAGAKGEPSEFEQPSEPANPGQPGESEQPSEPSNPDQPGEPEQPAEPEQPSNPVEPSEPEQPAVPAEPEQPSEPEQPEAPVNPDLEPAPAPDAAEGSEPDVASVDQAEELVA